jgi:hypothetical protein
MKIDLDLGWQSCGYEACSLVGFGSGFEVSKSGRFRILLTPDLDLSHATSLLLKLKPKPGTGLSLKLKLKQVEQVVGCGT